LNTNPCPACNTVGVKFPLIKAPQRVITSRCRACGADVFSEVHKWKYFGFFFYLHLVIPLVGVVFILGVVRGNFGWAALSAFAIVLLTYAPAVILHTRFSVTGTKPTSQNGTRPRYGHNDR